MPSRRPALLNLSGGYDSALVMYLALREGRRLLVHHINLIDREKRNEVEGEAVRNIIAWHRKQGLNKFTYVESTFRYPEVDGHPSQFLVKNYHIYSFLTGVLLADPRWRGIEASLIPRHREALNSSNPNAAARRSDRVLRSYPTITARRAPRLEYPIASLNKKQVIQRLPAELRDLCWGCRRPKKVGREFHECGRCFTCRQVQKARADLGLRDSK